MTLKNSLKNSLSIVRKSSTKQKLGTKKCPKIYTRSNKIKSKSVKNLKTNKLRSKDKKLSFRKGGMIALNEKSDDPSPGAAPDAAPAAAAAAPAAQVAREETPNTSNYDLLTNEASAKKLGFTSWGIEPKEHTTITQEMIDTMFNNIMERISTEPANELIREDLIQYFESFDLSTYDHDVDDDDDGFDQDTNILTGFEFVLQEGFIDHIVSRMEEYQQNRDTLGTAAYVETYILPLELESQGLNAQIAKLEMTLSTSEGPQKKQITNTIGKKKERKKQIDEQIAQLNEQIKDSTQVYVEECQCETFDPAKFKELENLLIVCKDVLKSDSFSEVKYDEWDTFKEQLTPDGLVKHRKFYLNEGEFLEISAKTTDTKAKKEQCESLKKSPLETYEQFLPKKAKTDIDRHLYVKKFKTVPDFCSKPPINTHTSEQVEKANNTPIITKTEYRINPQRQEWDMGEYNRLYPDTGVSEYLEPNIWNVKSASFADRRL